jgi:type IV pilus assembly protein PilO
MGLQVNINWKQLEKIPLKQKAAGLVALVVLMVGLYFYFLHLPKQKELVKLQGTLAQVQREYNEKKAIADNLPTFQEEVRRLNERFVVVLEKLPTSSDIDQILIDLPNLAKEEELIVKSFRPGRDVPRGFYAAVPLSLSLVGDYNRLAKFFEKVGRLNRIIAVGDIALKPGTDGLEATVSAQTFKFIQEPATPAAAATQGKPARGGKPAAAGKKGTGKK